MADAVEVTLVNLLAGANGGQLQHPEGRQFVAMMDQLFEQNVDDVADDDMILDIGPVSAKALAEIISNAGTVVWNGPVGVFEMDAFANGTKALAAAIASSSAFTLAGGGDTVSAINVFKIEDKVGYISTAGGAFLEFLEGKRLPAVDILESRFKD